jgi:spermidine synthase
MSRSAGRDGDVGYRLLQLSLFLSGAAALVYEVVWIRRLTFLTGSGVYALTATLVAFMGGMALGGWVLGKVADRSGARPFRMVVLLQLGIMAGAVGSLLLQPLLIPPLAALYAARGPGVLLTAARFLGAILLLGVPTFLMGATLPAAVRGAASRAGVGTGVASLYAVNTLGGIAGVLLSGFLLLPAVGLTVTFVFGLLLSAAAAVACLSVRGVGGVDPEDVPETGEICRGRDWLAAGFLVGASMLAAEVLWSRVLVSGIFNNSFAVSTMLASVLTGIAFGSFLAGRVRNRGRSLLLRLLALLTVWLPLSGLILREGLPLLERMSSPDTLAGALAVRFLPGFLLILPASVVSGMIFPLLADLGAPRASVAGRGVGRLAGANTAGAVAGSLLCTFVALPLVGLRGGFFLTAVPLVLGLLILGGTRGWRRWTAPTAVLAAAVLTTLAGRGYTAVPEGFRLLMHVESPGGEVTVFQNRDMPSSMIIDVGGSQASTTTPEGCLKNRLMAYYPLLMHPEPRNVCVICFGTGITAGTAAAFPTVENLDCVEINASVTAAASFFSGHNHGVLSNSVTRLIIEDGRNHLLGTGMVYDVITEEPMHPALAGVVSLYTREYYLLARDRLAPGGIMSQWLPLYAMSDADCRMVVATFLDVFPNSTMWLLGRDAMLTGRLGQPIDPLVAAAHLSDVSVSSDLAPFGLDLPWVFLATLVMGPAELAEYSAGAPVVSDDRPILEYSAPEAVYGPSTVAGNIEAIMALASPATGAVQRYGDDFLRAREAVRLFEEAESARDRRMLSDEAQLLSESFTVCPEFLLAGGRLASSLHQSAALMLDRGNPQAAWEMMNRALATGMGDAMLLADLASMEVILGLYPEALEHSTGALRMEPGSLAALRSYGKAALGSGDQEAARWAITLADSLEVD